MSPSTPLLSSRQVVAALKRGGFRRARKTKSSHQAYQRVEDGRTFTATVPLGKKEIPRGTLESIKMIGRYERDENEPTASVLGRLALALRTSTDYLVGLSDDPEVPNPDSPTRVFDTRGRIWEAPAGYGYSGHFSGCTGSRRGGAHAVGAGSSGRCLGEDHRSDRAWDQSAAPPPRRPPRARAPHRHRRPPGGRRMMVPTLETADATCAECWRPLIWLNHSGWVHRDGRGHTWQECTNCSWQGSESVAEGCCPSCGSTRSLRDHHGAAPRGFSR